MGDALNKIFEVAEDNDSVDKLVGLLDSTRKEIVIYNETTGEEEYRVLQITISPTPPVDPFVGQLWIDNS